MSNYIYTNEGLVNADELMHYGVPGMRWGHKKARPISTTKSVRKQRKLLEKEYGKLEDQMTYGKKANVKKNAEITKKMNAIEKKLNDMDKTDKKSLSEKQKIAIAVGATAVATGLAAYGAHKLSTVIKDRAYTKAMDAGKKSVESYIDNFGAKPYTVLERMHENQRFAYEDYGRSATKAIKNAISNNYAKGRGVDWKRVYGYFK